MRTIRILNLGAGVESTSLYLMAMRQDEPEHVPPFDYAIFADTQEEPQAVYHHLEWLKSLGGPPILTATAGKLGDNLISGLDLTGNRFVSIPVFLKVEGQDKEGRSTRQCTRDFKIDVIERSIRRQILNLLPYKHIPKDVEIVQHIGFSRDEPARIIKAQARFQGKRGFAVRFPLWNMQWGKADCRSYLKEVAPGRKIVKSACVFCPYHSNAEWRYIRDEDPEGWARALEIDRALRVHGSRCNRDLESTAYLHRSCVPLEEAKIDDPETKKDQYLFGFAQECEGHCGL